MNKELEIVHIHNELLFDSKSIKILKPQERYQLSDQDISLNKD